MNINVDNLLFFYLILAIFALAFAIVGYGLMNQEKKLRRK